MSIQSIGTSLRFHSDRALSMSGQNASSTDSLAVQAEAHYIMREEKNGKRITGYVWKLVKLPLDIVVNGVKVILWGVERFKAKKTYADGQYTFDNPGDAHNKAKKLNEDATKPPTK